MESNADALLNLIVGPEIGGLGRHETVDTQMAADLFSICEIPLFAGAFCQSVV